MFLCHYCFLLILWLCYYLLFIIFILIKKHIVLDGAPQICLHYVWQGLVSFGFCLLGRIGGHVVSVSFTGARPRHLSTGRNETNLIGVRGSNYNFERGHAIGDIRQNKRKKKQKQQQRIVALEARAPRGTPSLSRTKRSSSANPQLLVMKCNRCSTTSVNVTMTWPQRNLIAGRTLNHIAETADV